MSRRRSTTRSTNGFSSISGAQCGSITHVTLPPGRLCLSEDTAGSVCTMSPRAPSRTTRIRPLAGLPPLSIFDQAPRTPEIVGFQSQDLGRLELSDKAVKFVMVGSYHVVYHA